MAHEDREARDAAGVGPYARERENLVTLTSLGAWDVSEGDPDIRGWEVRTVSGRQLGAVAELLVDPKAGEVVMLDVDLPGTDRHSYVPIRVVEIDRARRVILMDSADLPETGPARAAPVERTVVPVSERTVVPTSEVRTSDVRPLRYSRSDREVVVDPVHRADDVPVTEDAIASERRRAERRRIERLSTDL